MFVDVVQYWLKSDKYISHSMKTAHAVYLKHNSLNIY
jgi:hypothetical protein